MDAQAQSNVARQDQFNEEKTDAVKRANLDLIQRAAEWINLDQDLIKREEITKLAKHENFDELGKRLHGWVYHDRDVVKMESSKRSLEEKLDLFKRGLEWIYLDANPDTREEMTKLMRKEDFDELKTRLNGRIKFGTAGLRARMEAGSTRMNSLTVIQTSQGLADYLLSQFDDAKERGVVIGRDTRNNSDKFATAAAEAFKTKGIPVHWYPDPVHTPLVPFAVTHLGAVAGVMITASHNPKNDNGYKLYWRNGCQIIPPHDRHIAEAIEKNLIPFTHKPRHENQALSLPIKTDIQDLYFEKVAQLARLGSELPEFVYTPLHGVGFRPFVRAINHICGGNIKGWEPGDPISFHVVPEQQYPHPDFPTVKFPNPEEKHALDLAVRTAKDKNVSLIIANDPDADRLAVVERVDRTLLGPEAVGDLWHQYTGNEVGLLLASHILESIPEPAMLPKDRYIMLRSAVSADTMDTLTETRNCGTAETLTGFKWLGNAASDYQNMRTKPLFAFEEALGYMFPSIVLDKDGVSAGAVFLAATAKWQKDSSITPWQKLQDLYQKYGFYAEENTYLTSPSPETTVRVFDHIRTLDRPDPTFFADIDIIRWRDLTLGHDTGTDDNKTLLPVDPTSQFITFWARPSIKFSARASGTEPKIKVYLQHIGTTMKEAQAFASAAVDVIIDQWFQPEKNGLTRAPKPHNLW